MMVNILRSELLRLISTRSFTGFLIVSAVLACWVSISGASAAAPITANEVELAQQGLAEGMKAWEAQVKAWQMECGDSSDWACSELASATPPTLEDYLRPVIPFSEQVRGVTHGLGITMLVVVTVFVSLHIGSQFTTGGVATQLTFIPERHQVLWAKVIMGSLAAGVMGLFGLVIGLLMNVLASMWLQAGVADLGVHGSLGLLLLRLFTASLLAGTLSALLAIIFSSSWKGLLVIALVLYGTQVMLLPFERSTLADLLLPHRYIAAVILESYPTDIVTGDGFVVGHDDAVTFWEGTSYCLLVLALLSPLAMWLFRRRDMAG